ncbi:phage virion morphogenesis protein [Rhizobium cremeum]|uniref:phage virion morphogenesis protein n=1 Tax=Rhizobium cremeum TaxID=2813827 RepID=UPI001FD1EB48|nr:phage virion morphogenesis protein [Rhizobium cremeum]MCJ7996074.1 phage virion morphogenesis protein [Rhizobium cremeum]MCJ8001333.1 phage virion morphogenesis protein [Rhizobium cremeum]
MTGISYKTTINDADMRRKTADIIDRMERPRGFYKSVGEHLLISVDERFEKEQAPDGTPWKELSAVTVERREAAGYGPRPILRVTGAFRGSFNYEASDADVRVGTAAVQGAMMHFGGESKGYMKGKIEARPILGLSPNDETEIFAIAEEWLTVE